MKIHLAADIADAVLEAQEKGEAVDVPSRARELLALHPEATATVDEVADVLRMELCFRIPSGGVAPVVQSSL